MTDRAADDDLEALLVRIPVGWSRHRIDGRAWSLTRVDRADGGVVTLYGEQLGGTDRIGANVWRTADGPVLRPCEMPAGDVLAVLRAIPDPH